MFNEIVVAFDGSDHSEAAVRTASDLSKKYDANLHVVHVPELYDQGIALGASAVVIPVSEEALQESGQSMLERAGKIANDAGVQLASSEVRTAPAGDAIISFAEEKGASLIVSGRRGLGNLRGLLLGSVSQQVASSADCAVLTVK